MSILQDNNIWYIYLYKLNLIYMDKLYRSETDKMLGGVCGGFAQYLKMDSSILRLIFVAFTLFGGSGFLVYLICWIVIPSQSSIYTDSEDIISENTQDIKETVKKSTQGFKTEVKSDSKKEDK